MAVPLLAIIIPAIIVAVGGGAMYAYWSDPDLEDVIDSVRKRNEFSFLRQVYKENYPSHNEDQFMAYLMYFLAGVVAMRKAGRLSYADYASDSNAPVYKIYNTYMLNEKKPEWDLIKKTWELLVVEAYKTSDGKKHLKEAEDQNWAETMRNSFQLADKLLEIKQMNPEFTNEYAEKWIRENADFDAGLDEFKDGWGGFGLSVPNIAMIGLIGLGILLLAGRR